VPDGGFKEWPPPQAQVQVGGFMEQDSAKAYWKANRTLITILLVIWGLVSYVFAIFLARPLYDVSMGQVPMSFWWAQQGSMVVFVILIFVYAKRMDTLDRKFDVHED
jgi:putative solute:sodium symporter small subunit